MDTLFKSNDGRKIRKHDTNILKDMRITDRTFQTNKKLFVMIHPKNACKLEFADHV